MSRDGALGAFTLRDTPDLCPRFLAVSFFLLGFPYRWLVLERKKAKNFYATGRRLARLYLVGYGEFVSAVSGGAGAFCSGSPTAGLFLKERRQRTFTSRDGA